MTSAFRGRFAVVTGVTSGIGRATVERLLAEGAAVAGIARNLDRLASFAASAGSAFVPIHADLSDPAERARASLELRALRREVHIFVSNAAEAAYESPLSVSSEALKRLFEVNVCAPLELCQTLAPLMPSGGHVVQLSSVTARFLAAPKYGAYAASKIAIERLSEALRLELAPRGIRVSIVSPGLVDTPIYDKIPSFAGTKARLREQIPQWLEAEDVADAIVWLLSRPRRVVITELTVMPENQAR